MTIYLTSFFASVFFVLFPLFFACFFQFIHVYLPSIPLILCRNRYRAFLQIPYRIRQAISLHGIKYIFIILCSTEIVYILQHIAPNYHYYSVSRLHSSKSMYTDCKNRSLAHGCLGIVLHLQGAASRDSKRLNCVSRIGDQ